MTAAGTIEDQDLLPDENGLDDDRTDAAWTKSRAISSDSKFRVQWFVRHGPLLRSCVVACQTLF